MVINSNKALFFYSIDDDILNLIDEVDPEREINEIAEALAEPSKFPEFVRRKSAKAIAKFLVSSFALDEIICGFLLFWFMTDHFFRIIYQKCQSQLRGERSTKAG